MREAYKATRRRRGDGFWDDIFSGEGLDVSQGDNAIQPEWYGKIHKLNRGTGDYQQDLRKYRPDSFDFVNVGECLEHEASVFTSILSWFHLVKMGGHMVITVPDFRLYESCQWPSVCNTDHKWSFSILPNRENPHSRHINIIDFLASIPGAQVRRIHLADSNFNYSMFKIDQTLGEAEADIEVVIRKLPISDVKRKTFKHSGARGDLVYSLPAVMKLGGGTIYINRKKDHFFGYPLEDKEMEGIIEFLKTQPYIENVLEWDGQEVDYDLDLFRTMDPMFMLLSSAFLMRFGVHFDLSKPWLSRDKIPAVNKADIVVSRTGRYHSPFDWKELKPWVDRAVFVGLESEYTDFLLTTGLEIRYEPTKTWMDLAGVILGSKLFIGNQSLQFSLAEAMKHPRVLEVYSRCPNCDPQSSNGHVRLNQKVIRKYLLGEEYNDVVRVSRSPKRQIGFDMRKTRKEDLSNVSCVLVGKQDNVDKYENDFRGFGLEVVRSQGDTFEGDCNEGMLKATRRITCFVDCDLSPDKAAIMAVIETMLKGNVGMIAPSTSLVGNPHPSGACFAISRDTFEKAGLFNLRLRPGEAGMLEMNIRYMSVGVICRSLGIPGWVGRQSSLEDETRNRNYMDLNYGVSL